MGDEAIFDHLLELYVALLVAISAQSNSPRRYHHSWLVLETDFIGPVHCMPADGICSPGFLCIVRSSSLAQGAFHIYLQSDFTYEGLSYSSSATCSIHHVRQ